MKRTAEQYYLYEGVYYSRFHLLFFIRTYEDSNIGILWCIWYVEDMMLAEIFLVRASTYPKNN